MGLNLTTTNFFLLLSGGILPALFWLWFWLKEDLHPEPPKMIIAAFGAGMAGVFFTLAIEYGIAKIIQGWVMLLLWAFIEEIIKYLAAKKAALSKPAFDEPFDAIVYMITAALGFAAMENIFFLYHSFSLHGPELSFITGNLRFIGATLLHTATSSIVGASIAYSFFHKEKTRHNVIGGVILASILHFVFNYFIIGNNGSQMLKIFIPLWTAIILMIFLFERVKKINK